MMSIVSQWDNYAYAEKAQEVKRLESSSRKHDDRKERDAAEARAAKRKRNAAWSQQVETKERRDTRKIKRERKRQWLKTHVSGSSTIQAGKKTDEDGGDGDEDGSNGDWEELAREERMAKKVRRGQVTQKEFDEAFGGLV